MTRSVPTVLPADIPEVLPAGAEEVPWVLPTRRGGWGTVCYGSASSLEWAFGAATLVVALAVLAATPVLQFLSLGYLLEAAGRVARTGRLRAGFIGVRRAARVGGIVLGTWLV